MGIKNTVEYLYLGLMLRWEDTAPPDRHEALLDGSPARNTQITRFAYIVRKIAAGQEKRVYQKLARYSRRNDGHSYVSKDFSWMKEPYSLSSGWYFEGCTNLSQKQDILRSLTHLGISPTLIAAIDDFVAGKSIKSYIPSDKESEKILQRSIEAEMRDEDENNA